MTKNKPSNANGFIHSYSKSDELAKFKFDYSKHPSPRDFWFFYRRIIKKEKKNGEKLPNTFSSSLIPWF